MTYNEEMSGSEDEGDHDAYLEHMKREGKQREEDEDETDSSGVTSCLAKNVCTACLSLKHKMFLWRVCP